MCSVVCLTYNQEAYIAKALDGFVMQKASFPIEVVVHDDASTDNTAAIVRQYEARYPQLFVCRYETENQYSKQGHTICNDVVIRDARGRYIALCEGDDYWIDANKLEKQVAFMETNPECSMSFHGARIDYADGSRRSRVHRYGKQRIIGANEVILGGGGFYMTCTAMFKREVFDEFPAFLANSPAGDLALALNAITKGTVGYIDEVMAVYSKWVPGSWTRRLASQPLSERLEGARQLEIADAEFDRYTGYRFTKWIRKRGSRSALIALIGRACEGGCYEQYWKMRSTMLPRDRVLFHIGYVYLRLKRLVRRTNGGQGNKVDV